MKKIILICIISVLAFNINAQTGPGGVGSTDGSSGQPQNVLWLIADSLSYSDGTDIATWNDMSGNSNDLTQTNSSYTPIFQDDASNINGHPRAEFSKSNNRIIINPFNDMPSSGITTFIIYKTTDSGDGLVSYAVSSSNNNTFLLYDNNLLRTYIDNSAHTPSGPEPDYNSGNWQIMSHQWKSSGGDLLYYRNGDQIYSTNFQNGASMSSGGCLAIGGEQDAVDGSYQSGQAFQGDIAEIIMYNSFLNSAQRLIVENYLSQKYNLAFATVGNDKYGNDTDYDAAYVYNIAGIGQEADGDHTQTSSGGLYLYERNTTMANGEYVMLGHNNTTNSSSTATTNNLTGNPEKRWARDWYIEKTGTVETKLIFDFKEALSDGEYPANVSNYTLLYRSGTSGNYSEITVAAQGLAAADQVYFDVSDANLLDGYYTIASNDTVNSPIEGSAGRTWYALASGDWDNSDFWTLDPSGSLPNNPSAETPASSDKVVIHTGKTITLSSNTKTLASITVEGILELGTTTGHNFTEIRGNGRIRLASDNFPLGDATHFTSAGQGEGTVVWQGGSYNLSTAYTFYKMEVDLDNAANTITLLADYTLNGDLVVETGILQINNNTATTNLNIEVQGDITVESTGQILTGTANARHQLDIYGDFTNNGIVKFTNRTAANYTAEATDGIVDANFLSDNSNQTVLCDSVTNFYRIEIDKGTDMTYELAIEASSTANFNLFGYANQGHGSTAQLTSNTNALGLLRGTVKIGSNIVINRLSNSGNYNISEAARLLVNGGTVYNNNGNSTVPYGTIEVSAGLLESKVTSGITTRDNGLIKISGGTINTNVIRTSVLGAGNVGGYIQSGGTVNIVNPGSSTTTYYHFSMTYPGNTFIMTGGTLHVYDANGTNTNQGGIFIASDPSNVNVTGGTVIAEIASTSNTFKITSKAPFYNLILRNTNDATTDHSLNAGTNINNSAAADLAAQPLVVLNDFTIETNVMLKHNGENISVGGDLSISRNAQAEGNNRGIYYDATVINTLSLNGSGNSSFYIGYNTGDATNWEYYAHNFEINKDNATDTVTILTDVEKDVTTNRNRILYIVDTMSVKKGVLYQGKQSVRLFGETYVYNGGQLGVYEVGVKPSAVIMLKDGILHTEDGAILGNSKLGTSGTVTLTSDVYMQRLVLITGLFNLKTYNLKIDYLHRDEPDIVNNYKKSDGSTGEMIYSDANASDGGISLLITGNGTYCFPLGTATKYTYAEVVVSNFSDDGYIQIRPVDDELKTTNLSGGDLLNYYWRVGYEGFTNRPTVQYEFKYDDGDIVGTESGYYPGKVLDEGLYSRSYENDLTKVDDANNTITFNDTGSGFPLEKANYTAGVANRFSGSVQVYYSCLWNGWTGNNWSDPNVWSTVSHESTVNAGTYPQAGDIARVGYDTKGTNTGSGGDYHSILCDINNIDVAALIFDGDGTTWNPRVYVKETQTHTFNMISGRGGFVERVSPSNIPTVNADFGDFTNNDEAYFYYHCRANGTTTLPTHEVYPNLRIEGNTSAGVGSRILIFPVDIKVNRDMRIDGGATIRTDNGADGDVTVERGFYVGGYRDGAFEFSTSGTARTLTVKGDITIRDGQTQSPNNILTVLNTTPSNLEHKIILYGNLIHREGTIDLFTDNAGGNNVILELQDEQDASYTYVAGSTPDLYRIVMNKGTSQTNSFTFSDDFDLNGPTSGADVLKALELQNGTLILDDTNIDIDLTTGDDDFEIPETACLEVKNGTVNVSGNNSGIALDGKLLISGGTVNMDDAANNGNNYIEYSASGNATIEITSGALTVGSQIRRGLNSTAGVLNYSQSGGTVIVGKNAAPEGKRGVFEIINTGSSFTHSGGDITIVNQQTNPTIATLYLDPETSSLSTGTTIRLGNGDTPTNTEFGIYSTINLQNLTLNTDNSPTAKMWTIPLAINDTLLIQANTEFNANGLNLNLYGDFLNSGTFTASQNTTYFKGTANQEINGDVTFYNLTNQNTANLNLTAASSDITIDNVFVNESGATINDNSNDIYVAGNIEMAGTHVYGGSNDGITLNGTSQQVLTGSGTFGKLTINNATGIDVPVGNEFTINNYFKLQSGVFDIGGNLLTLNTNCIIQEANPFGKDNMIQINASFTDNGVKKIFPSGAIGFTYPIGSGGKYTPVEITSTSNTATNAYLIAKAADEIHPSIVDDSEGTDPDIVDQDNVLQYYWVLTANGFTNLDATIKMTYDTADVEVTTPYDVYDYITARLLNDGTGNWLKYNDVSKFDEVNKNLIFDIAVAEDIDITGDYTAGVDGSSFEGAIPDQVPLYQSNGAGGTLDWNTASTWRVDDGTGTWVLPATEGLPPIPKGARVRILASDIVKTSANYISAYTSEINGTLDVNTTYGNRVGNVSGTGTLYTERGSLPAGFYETFFSSAGGTIEFGGSTDYSVLSNISQVNNLTFSGTGNRELPNIDLTILGDLLFSDAGTSSPDVINEFDKNLLVGGNITFNAGTFDAGIGTSEVSMNGDAAQTIGGNLSFTGTTNSFWNFEIDNSADVTLNKAIDIDNDLALTDGVITTTSTNILSIKNTLSTAVTAYGSSSYVDGPMRKNIITNGNFIFPIGDNNRYGKFAIYNTTNASTAYWKAEYFNTAYSDLTTNPSSFNVSGDEYWSVDNPTAGDAAEVEVRWDSHSGITPLTTTNGASDIVVAEYDGTDWIEKTSAAASGTNYLGTVKTSSAINTNPIYYTLGAKSAILAKAHFTTTDDVCDGESISISFSGVDNTNLNFTISYEIGGTAQSDETVSALPYSLPTSGAGTYKLTGFKYDSGASTGVVDNATVTVNATPAQPVITPEEGNSSLTFCEGGNVDLSTAAATGYLWSTGETTQTINVENSGSYTVQVSNVHGCSSVSSTARTVTENPLPIANPTATDATIYFGSNSQLDAGISGAYTYLWSPAGSELSNSGIQNPIYTPGTNPTSPTQVTTTFTVTVTDNTTHCADVEQVDVVVNRKPETGNVFTNPN